MSTTPWPSRTETPPLVFPLKARRSETQALNHGYAESF